jgi:hypothetical protein
LLVIESKTYSEIESIIGLEKKVFAPWWEELKE